MKKKIQLMGIAIGFLIVSIIGGSIAYFRAESDAQNPISTGNLGVELKLKNNQKNNTLIGNGAVPGSVYDYGVEAYNSGDYDSYVKVTLTKYWEDQAGNKNFDADSSKIELLGMDKENWIIDDSDENGEVVYCYYKKPIASHTSTSQLLDSVKVGSLSNKDQNLYTALQMRLDVEVDAIQKVAAQDAILAEWGLDVSFDDNGTIVNVEE